MGSRKIKGFTLIELIVVIAIIAVLAAIIVPSIFGYTASSKIATANANAKLAYNNACIYSTSSDIYGYALAPGNYSFIDLAEGEFNQAYPLDGTKDGLEKALQSLMGGDDNSGYATIIINDEGTPVKSAWGLKINDKFIGGYPISAYSRTGEVGGVTLETAEFKAQ